MTATVTHGDAEIEAAAFAQLAARPHAGLIYATINTRLIKANPAFLNRPTILLNCHCVKSPFAPSSLTRPKADTRRRVCSFARSYALVTCRDSCHGSFVLIPHGSQRRLHQQPTLLRGSLASRRLQPPSGHHGAHAFMALSSPPTAIFSANDMMAVGCYDALRELGLPIPQDFAVIGYDDREIARHMHPPLSTVVLPHYAWESARPSF